jgi:DivIVA domain-containing protein
MFRAWDARNTDFRPWQGDPRSAYGESRGRAPWGAACRWVPGVAAGKGRIALAKRDLPSQPEGDDAASSEDAGLPSSEFDTVRRGYAPDQVAEYLQRVAALVLSLEAEISEKTSELLETKRERDEARAALEASAARDPNDGASDRVTELVQTFDHEVSGLLRDAQVEAERLQSDVRMEADRILAHASEEAKRALGEAEAEADRIRADARMLERQSQLRAGRVILEAREEADRAESHLASVRGRMLETFGDIRERTITALGEVEAVIQSGATSDRVVIVDEAVELAGDDTAGLAADAAAPLAPADLPEVPRPDL